jgi:hypothetical protein
MLESLTSLLSRLPVAVRAGIALAILGGVPLALWIALPRGTVEPPAISSVGQQETAISAATLAQPDMAIQGQGQAGLPAGSSAGEVSLPRTNWPLVWIAWGVWAVAISVAVLASLTYRLWSEMKDAVKARSA